MEYGAIEDFLYKQGMDTSFQGIVEQVQAGREESIVTVLGNAGSLFFTGLSDLKGDFIQLLGICLLFGLLCRISKAYGKEQMLQYGYYVYFICGASICIHLFLQGYDIVFQTIRTILDFMEVFMPTFLLALTFSSGMNTSATYYGLILLVLFLAEFVLFGIFLPGTRIYMAIQFVSESIRENMFSKLLKLYEDIFSLGLKTILTGICGIHTLQGLLVPAIDEVRRVSAYKTVSILPGIGNLAGSATEVLLSSGKLIKNSVGVAAVIIFILLCAPAVIKLVALELGLRILEAFVEPLLGESLTGLLECTHKSIGMLVKLQVHTLALFALTLVLLTAFS